MEEVWIPSPHYGGGHGPFNLAVLHLTVGATTIESLGSWFQNPGAQCSSHHGADNYKRGVFGAYVYESNTAWTQGNANNQCESIELCTPENAQNWSRSKWLNEQDTLLRNAAEWVAYITKTHNIPLVALNASQSQNGGRGVTQHMFLGQWGTNHSDCGSGFPMDKVIEWAKGGVSPSPIPEDDSGMTVSVATDSKGRAHYASIGTDSAVYYQPPTGGWFRCDNAQSGAKSGAGITIDKDDKIIITYTNGSNVACTYSKKVDGPTFAWDAIGGSVR
jgi:hypothetical protein